jgi:chromate transport protein ChrA
MQFISDNQRLQKILATLSIAVVTFIAGFAITIFQSLNSESLYVQVFLAVAGLFVLIKTKIQAVALLAITSCLYTLISVYLV